MTYERREQLDTSLATLLHAIFMHIDSRSAFVRTQMVESFEQLMRCIISVGANAAHNASDSGSTSYHVDLERTMAAKAQVERLFARRTFASWAAETSREEYDSQSKCQRTCSLLQTRPCL